jgi:hypothetical protein
MSFQSCDNMLDLSPALTVCLCAVSMSSSLARRSRISLSIAGSVICLPLLLGISLSSGGSGDCLSLLLGGMVNSLFLCYRKQRTFLCSDTKLDADAAPSTTRRSEGPRQHRIFPLPLARRTLNGSSISLSGNLHPQQTSWDPLFTLGRSDFATSRIQWSSVGLSNPRNPTTVNADLSFSFRDFPYRDFGTRDVEQLVSRLPNPDMPKLRYTREFDFSTPFTHRDFGLHNIMNPNAMFSGLLP